MRFELSSITCQTQALESTILVIRAKADEPSFDQLAHGCVQRLFGNGKNFQERIDRDPRIATDEIQYSVMHPPQSMLIKDVVRTRGKGTIREIEQFNGFAEFLLAALGKVNHIDMLRRGAYAVYTSILLTR